MKRLTTVILTFLTCGIVHALPVGNPLDSMVYTNHFCDWNNSCDSSCWYDMFNVRLGFYGDYVFNRRMESQSASWQTVSMNTNAGMIVLNFCDWIEAFGTIGATRLFVRNPGVFPVGGRQLDILTEDILSTRTSYSGGARAVLWNYNCFYLGAEGQYFYLKSQANWFGNYASGAEIYNLAGSNNLPYSEWQVALSASFLIEHEGLSFIPYAALQFASALWDWDAVGGSGSDVNDSQLVGWTIGTAVVLNNQIGVSCEARFANEKAFGVMGQLSF